MGSPRRVSPHAMVSRGLQDLDAIILQTRVSASSPTSSWRLWLLCTRSRVRCVSRLLTFFSPSRTLSRPTRRGRRRGR